MVTVNPNLVEALLYPLAGEADDDERTSFFESLETNNEEVIKEIIAKYFHPDFLKQPIAFQQSAKLSLAYYLTTNKIDFNRILQSSLLPFSVSIDPRHWFILMWKIYFKDEPFVLKDISAIKEINDPQEPLRLMSRK